MSVLLVMIGGYASRASDDAEPQAAPRTVITPASVTAPGPKDAVVVRAALSPNNRGWQGLGQDAASQAESVRFELMDAYSLAVANAPTGCHLSSSLLAAIGQVESGNLEGHRIDAKHRVTPAVLGPVLDGDEYAAIADTDDGKWDRNRKWDRAIGPMQLLPATWRVVGLDLDEDGVRDPQNIYDAAGAAMVYLCDAGRDLATRDGLVESVLAYNHSRAYLRQVLAWKTVFDGADLLGQAAMPEFGAWAAAPEPFAPEAPAPADVTSTAGTDAALAARQPGKTTKLSPRTSPAASAPSGAASPGSDDASGGDSTTPSTAQPTAKPSKVPTPAKSPGKKPGTPGASPATDPGTAPSEEPTPDVVATPSDPATCTPEEPTAGESAGEPDEAADLLAEGTSVCCVAPDGTTTLLTPTGEPTPVGTTDPEDGTLAEECEGATVLPVPETAPPAG